MSLKNISSIQKETFHVIAHNPMILFSFLILGVIDALALTALFLAHSAPFSKILAPVIRRFWGDRFLHYPDNFILLPKLFGYLHVVVLTVAGLIISGIVIKLIEARVNGYSNISILSAAGTAFRRYFSLLAVWVPAFLLMRYGSRWLLPVLPASLPVQFTVLTALFLVIQTLTAFLFPAVMISDQGFFRAVKEGAVLTVKNAGLILGIIFIPALAGVAVSLLKHFSPAFIPVFPESVLLILYLGVVVSVAVDLFITSSMTILYLKVRNTSV